MHWELSSQVREMENMHHQSPAGTGQGLAHGVLTPSHVRHCTCVKMAGHVPDVILPNGGKKHQGRRQELCPHLGQVRPGPPAHLVATAMARVKNSWPRGPATGGGVWGWRFAGIFSVCSPFESVEPLRGFPSAISSVPHWISAERQGRVEEPYCADKERCS